MATAQEIRNRALTRMGVLPAGETARDAHAASVDAAYSGVYAKLEIMDMATWDLDEAIPAEFEDDVVALVAYARIDEFNVTAERYQRIVRDAVGTVGDPLFPGAIRNIRALQSGDVVDQPAAEYF